jgi:hypothetical protein
MFMMNQPSACLRRLYAIFMSWQASCTLSDCAARLSAACRLICSISEGGHDHESEVLWQSWPEFCTVWPATARMWRSFIAELLLVTHAITHSMTCWYAGNTYYDTYYRIILS